jgi:hypothetical protein
MIVEGQEVELAFVESKRGVEGLGASGKNR